MDIETYQIDGKKSGIASLSDSIFSLEPDVSIMSALVQWSESNQKPLRARTKNRSEVKGTTQKYGRQKGGGGARHGSKKANIFRSGGMAHNLRGERSAKQLSKKFKAIALRHVLSSKMKNKEVILYDKLVLKEPKTKTLQENLSKLNISSALIVEGDSPDNNFVLATRNLKYVKFTNANEFSALDVLKYNKFVMSKDAISNVEKRILK
jgi:large subunit ribosomal protein L4